MSLGWAHWVLQYAIYNIPGTGSYRYDGMDQGVKKTGIFVPMVACYYNTSMLPGSDSISIAISILEYTSRVHSVFVGLLRYSSTGTECTFVELVQVVLPYRYRFPGMAIIMAFYCICLVMHFAMLCSYGFHGIGVANLVLPIGNISIACWHPTGMSIVQSPKHAWQCGMWNHG